MNAATFNNLGFGFAAGGSMNYIQIILITVPSTIFGYILETIIQNPGISIMGPLLVFLGRDIQRLQMRMKYVTSV